MYGVAIISHTGWHTKKSFVLYVYQAVRQFWKWLTSGTAVKDGHVNTVFNCSTWPPFIAMIEVSRFRNHPIPRSTWGMFHFFMNHHVQNRNTKFSGAILNVSNEQHIGDHRTQ